MSHDNYAHWKSVSHKFEINCYRNWAACQQTLQNWGLAKLYIRISVLEG